MITEQKYKSGSYIAFIILLTLLLEIFFGKRSWRNQTNTCIWKMASSRLKENFVVESKCEAFFTGSQIQFSEEGNYLFCSCGNVINILDVKTGQVIKTIGSEEANDEITSFIVSPNDQFLVTAAKNLLLQQWDWKEEKIVQTWKAVHISPVSCMAFDCTSTLLATGGCDGTIKMWDINKQYCTHNLKGSCGVIRLVKFHPDISLMKLFSTADDYKIRIWNLQNGRCETVLDDHFSSITSIEITCDGDKMVSSGRDKVVIVWDLKSLKATKVIPVYEAIESMMIIPEGKAYPSLNVKANNLYVITAGDKGILRVWNSQSAQCVYSQKQEDNSTESLNQVAISETNDAPEQNIIFSAVHKKLETVVVVTFERNILFYSLKDLKLFKQFIGHNDEVLDLRIMGEKDTHIAVATNSPHIKVYTLKSLACQLVKGHSDIILALEVFKDMVTLVSSSKDCTVRLWLMNEESSLVTCVGIAQGHTSPVTSISCTRLKNKYIVSGSEDQTLKIWKLSSCDFSSDTVQSLNNKSTVIAHDKDINSVVVSPNDKLIATGSLDKTAKLWILSSGGLLGTFRGHKKSIWCVQFSPVDQILATSSADGTIKLWNLSDFACVKTFEGHETSVLNICFLAHGMQILSCSSDGLMKLWTIKTDECVKTWDEHKDKIWALTVNRGENLVITGSADSKIYFWKDVTEEEKKAVREKKEETLLLEQELSNLLQQKKFVKALGIAIALDQPFRVLNILKEIMYDEKDEKDLTKVILKLRLDQLDSLLQYAAIWNMNAKHCNVAQKVIATILENFLPEELKTFPNIKSIVEGILPYSDRHFKRLDRLMEQVMFLEYTWQCMRPVI